MEKYNGIGNASDWYLNRNISRLIQIKNYKTPSYNDWYDFKNSLISKSDNENVIRKLVRESLDNNINKTDIKFTEEVTASYSNQINVSAYAWMDDKIIGYCDYSLYNGKVYIDMIHVEEFYRRQGIATMLFNFVKESNKGKEIVHV